MRIVVVTFVFVVCFAGCAIAPDDPLPGLGAPCAVADGRCDLEEVCRPNKAGDASGICVPVASYGACDATTRVTHPPGRVGKDKPSGDVDIAGPDDLGLIQGLRSVPGQVVTFHQGVPKVTIPDLCDFRTLQAVGDGLAIGDTDQVTSLDGLDSVTSVKGGLAIFDNSALTNLDGLVSLVNITPREFQGQSVDVVIAGNTQLTPESIDSFITQLEARLGRQVDKVVCNNRGGHLCSAGAESTLVAALIATGFR